MEEANKISSNRRGLTTASGFTQHSSETYLTYSAEAIRQDVVAQHVIRLFTLLNKF